ncbi:hypothetical protein EYF80_001889 [Liparis tanakae]|uniref:Uncharacterized protein n=1 Tax=Liparis tanakae TaxID=230148 RepID=A0A4Z2JC90_9TELE|nr:hypothetical protein EYF80_001889 [Liparis tanakae]
MHRETDVRYLVVHAVDPIGPQEINRLANEVCASTVQHPKTQVQVRMKDASPTQNSPASHRQSDVAQRDH